MRYEYVKPARKFRGPVHWGHVIYLYCTEEREEELRAFLDEVVGQNAWRLSNSWSNYKEPKDPKPTMATVLANTRRELSKGRLKIKFTDANHAMRLKLMWAECGPPIDLAGLNKVILPHVRKVMPTIIANDIIGVSPMTGPTTSIFSLRVKYEESKAGPGSSARPSEL